MKISLIGIAGIPLGKHNVKDPRLDQVHQLVEADKKVYLQVDLISADQAADADALLVSDESCPDLILKDWEFVETRSHRTTVESEKALLEKLKSSLESEKLARDAGLTLEETKAAAVYNLLTQRPVVVAQKAALENVDALLLEVLQASGYIRYLTVGGKENRAWLIKKGSTAWEAAGAIHSELQKGFIRAEIIRFEDLVQAGGETQAKRAGKMRLEHKEYVMQDCDIANFRVHK